MGRCQREISDPMRQINLLPADLRPTRGDHAFYFFSSAKGKYKELLYLAVFAVILSGVLGWQRFILWNDQLKVHTLRAKLVNMKKQDARRIEEEKVLEKKCAGLENEKQALWTRLFDLENASLSRGSAAAVLSDLVSLLPEELWIKELTLTDGALKIAGSATDTKTITDFIDRLDGSERFRDTHFGSTERAAPTDGGDFNFELSTAVAQNVRTRTPEKVGLP